MITMGYGGLKRLRPGLLFLWDRAARWRWNRHCHTDISSPLESMGVQTILPAYYPNLNANPTPEGRIYEADQTIFPAYYPNLNAKPTPQGLIYEADQTILPAYYPNLNAKPTPEERVYEADQTILPAYYPNLNAKPTPEGRIYEADQGWRKQMASLSWQFVATEFEERFDVKSTIEHWVKFYNNNREVPAGELKRILTRFRKDGRFSLALQGYEWMWKKGIYKFSSMDHAVHINLIYKVRGRSAAEHYVWNLPEQARNEKTYGELLRCYVHEDRTEKALFHFQKMKELGFVSSPRPFNEIMHLYAKSLQIDKVLGVLAELKKSNVLPDNDSYRICISSFGLKYDLEGMERMLKEMETQPHIVMDWCTYAVVAEFYEREFLVDKATDALKKAKMTLQKKNNRGSYNLMNSDYESVVKSLVKLGELAEAMKYAMEWEVLGNWRSVDDISIPYTIIEGYIRNGALKKAYYKIWDWTTEGKMGVYKLSRVLCNEYLKVGDLLQAFNCFRVMRYELGYLPEVMRLFIQYLEEECGSFFPLRCAGSLCTRSLKSAAGKTFFELIPVNVKYKFKVALLEHPENSAQAVKNMDYESVIKSLVESGELNEARKMAMEWGASGSLTSLDDLNISKLIIDGYCKQSLFMEAEAMAVAWTRDNKCWVGGIWLILACHYQEQGKMVRGFECMRRFFNLTPSLKGKDHLMIDMFVFMIEYSRGMNAAGYFGDRREDFLHLDRMLCPTEDH